ncbi:uncharacterized protein J3R85_017814 [Psidium guajava]|nr:uncharacterized protein J3R85_017814 [Psidium guajava]
MWDQAIGTEKLNVIVWFQLDHNVINMRECKTLKPKRNSNSKLKLRTRHEKQCTISKFYEPRSLISNTKGCWRIFLGQKFALIYDGRSAIGKIGRGVGITSPTLVPRMTHHRPMQPARPCPHILFLSLSWFCPRLDRGDSLKSEAPTSSDLF